MHAEDNNLFQRSVKLHAKAVKFGLQPSIFSSKVYVMHFPIRGRAEVRIKDLKKVDILSK